MIKINITKARHTNMNQEKTRQIYLLDSLVFVRYWEATRPYIAGLHKSKMGYSWIDIASIVFTDD